MIAGVGMSPICHESLQSQWCTQRLNQVSDYSAHAKTSDGIYFASSLALYSRNRFILNLLPLLQKATSLRRVVSVLSTTREGPIDMTDIQGRKLPFKSQIGQGASLVTLPLEAIAKKAPGALLSTTFQAP